MRRMVLRKIAFAAAVYVVLASFAWRSIGKALSGVTFDWDDD